MLYKFLAGSDPLSMTQSFTAIKLTYKVNYPIEKH